MPSAEELHAARHDTEDDTPAGRAVVCRRVNANARAAARAHIVALALVRIGDARGAVLRRTRIADTFREQESCGVGRVFGLSRIAIVGTQRRAVEQRPETAAFLGHPSGLTSQRASRVAGMPPKKKNAEPPTTEAGDDGDVATSETPLKKKTKKTKVELPEIIPQDPAPRQPIPGGTKTFKAISWNVAGLRALIEKQPEMFRKIVDAEQPDVIALQEHKLQDAHVEDLTKKLKALLPEYPTVTFACSTVKKGYSGVAVLCKARIVDCGDEVTR